MSEGWCPRCRKERQGTFCWRCGTRLTEKPEFEAPTCPGCDAEVDLSYMSYCPACGHPLRSWIERQLEKAPLVAFALVAATLLYVWLFGG